MGMTLCEVVRGLLEGLPHALFKGLGDPQESSEEEKPCLVTHAGLVPLPGCVFTVLEPRATNQNPTCKLRLTGAYAQQTLLQQEKHHRSGCRLAVVGWYYVLPWCWLTKHKHGRTMTCPHILPGLPLSPYSSPAHSCSEPYQSTPGYSISSKEERRQLQTYRLGLRRHGTGHQPCQQSHCSESGFS